MLMGKMDTRNYTESEAKQLHDKISTNIKELIFYESGHKLPAEWTEKATGWMVKHLK